MATSYTWQKAICPSCGEMVWFSAPQAVATVPPEYQHLVPATVMGECGHTVSARFLNRREDYEAAMVETMRRNGGLEHHDQASQ